MDIRPIRTEEDYNWALTEIAPYFDNVPEMGTPNADRFDVLADLISAYEARNHSVEPLNPVDFISTYMEEAGLQQGDLASVVGSASRASEFLNRKRPLTLSAIQKIHRDWRLPASILIQPYHLDDGDVGPLQAVAG
ncbi:MAG: XRE family transcriptional regulator [Paracoccaceae bacterium]|nr:XRE family transcriptional regulator [Paracoccaceae bacterium]